MPRPLILLLVFSLFSATVHGQEAKKPSPAVMRILDEAVRAVKRNRVDFDKANQKPLGEARKALDELSTKLIKDGKAEEATAVLRQVGTLEADVMKMANAPAPVGGGGAGAQKPLSERLEGKWDHPNTDVIRIFSRDGGYQSVKKKDGTAVLAGHFVETGAQESQGEAGGYRYLIRLSEDGNLMCLRQWNSKGDEVGTGMVLERIK